MLTQSHLKIALQVHKHTLRNTSTSRVSTVKTHRVSRSRQQDYRALLTKWTNRQTQNSSSSQSLSWIMQHSMSCTNLTCHQSTCLASWRLVVRTISLIAEMKLSLITSLAIFHLRNTRLQRSKNKPRTVRCQNLHLASLRRHHSLFRTTHRKYSSRRKTRIWHPWGFHRDTHHRPIRSSIIRNRYR